MNLEAFAGVMIPFVGTCLGSAFVFFLKEKVRDSVNAVFSGFAAGVMIAAAIWSLLIPSIEKSEHLGVASFVPSALGVWLGAVMLIVSDKILNKITDSKADDTVNSNLLPFFAVTVHNIPEGMAVGMVCAASMLNADEVPFASALALCMGVAVQNIPEGAIVSMPFYAEGKSKAKSFFLGVFSGAVEPVGAAVTLLAASFVSVLLPFLLAMAAGAMLYVTADKLIYEMKGEGESKKGIISFTAGFTLMMSLDVALG